MLFFILTGIKTTETNKRIPHLQTSFQSGSLTTGFVASNIMIPLATLAGWIAGGFMGGLAVLWRILIILSSEILYVHSFALGVLLHNPSFFVSVLFFCLFPSVGNFLSYQMQWLVEFVWYAFLLQMMCWKGSMIVVYTSRVVVSLVGICDYFGDLDLLRNMGVGESLTLCFVLWGIKTGALRCTLSQVITSLQVICGLSCSGSVFAQWILIVVGATSTGLIQRVQAFCKINDKQALSSFQPPPILDGLVERFTVDSQKELQLLFQVEEMNNELARTFRC
eukprot:TRINITY_DN4663_c0_g1_i4.p1 TRINITY_DN4663_c0_g1~~TRINITY_DN4663_c0_g1_i4.p1  ORF type:complete len:279 (-),score=66.15 TRINITY_DN4663_c0_g1_i4:245-1081(-)